MANNVLILSFESFSTNRSNGKTLWSLFENLDDDFSISQIYIKGPKPNIGKNCRYLYINENDLLKPFKSSRKILTKISGDDCILDSKTNYSNKRKFKKTPFKMLLRNFLWYLQYFKFYYVFKWIEEEIPEIIFLYDSDLPFFNFFAYKIKKRFKSKIIFYTTENYCLKAENYMSDNFKESVGYKIFKKILFNSHKKLFRNTTKELFLTKELLAEYNNNFKLNSPDVMYPSTSCTVLPNKEEGNILTFSYCGNLGVDRFQTLLIFLETIKDIKDIRVLVASKISIEEANIIQSFSFVKYLGYLNYEDVIKVYEDSDILFHIESFEEKRFKDCEHAFSGKIADCISSLKPFLYFGPSGNDISNFISINNCAFSIHCTNDLKKIINIFKKDRKTLFMHQENAKNTAYTFFDKKNNAKKFKKIISCD